MKYVARGIREELRVGDSGGMNTAWDRFTDTELIAEARNAQSHADALPFVLADPLHSLAGHMLTELARRRLAEREAR